MRKITVIIAAILMFCGCSSAEKRAQILFETNMGNIRMELYNETPIHRDNMLRLVKSGFYDGILFHRVIADFMIQFGDPDSRTAEPGVFLGEAQDTTVSDLPAEILYPELFHKRGALCAAREGNDVNPERKSSTSQFYIAFGRTYTADELQGRRDLFEQRNGYRQEVTPELETYYIENPGIPHLDSEYTVFGQVLEGIKVVEAIQAVETDENDRPLADVRILKASVVKDLK
ncbi:MAG: peptidylprolyl isomerase [Bacteroidales bacterium]|nr:peptidylprolyl isomerase [Bacteroidales bacterium]